MHIERAKVVKPRCSFCGEEADAVVVHPSLESKGYQGYKLYSNIKACAVCISKAWIAIQPAYTQEGESDA